MRAHSVGRGFGFCHRILSDGAYTRMKSVLSDILYYVTLVVFWIVFPAAFVICFGFGLGFIIILCLAAIVMDVIALIVGESENG